MDDALPSDSTPVVSVEPEVSTVSVVVDNSTSNDDEEADMDVEDDEMPAPPMADMGEPVRVPAEAGSFTGVSEKENGSQDFAGPRALKRKRDEIEDEESSGDDVAEESGNPLALKVNPDGSVEQVDSVRYVEHFIRLSHVLTR